MNWNDIRYILAVSREGSTNRAGQRLGVNHATVARRIADLEEHLKTRLFDRSRSGYALNPAGERILSIALDMEANAHAIERALLGWDDKLSGSLKFTTPPDMFDWLIAPHLPGFLTAHPNLELIVLDTMKTMDLDSREADIALRLSPGPPEHLIGRRMMPFAHGVYGSATYIDALARGEQEPSLLFFSETQHVPDWVRFYFPKARVSLRTYGARSMASMVRAGLGLAYLSCFMADADPTFRRLDLDLEELNWDVWVLNHPDTNTAASMRAYRTFLIKVLEDARPLITGHNSIYSDYHPHSA